MSIRGYLLHPVGTGNFWAIHKKKDRNRLVRSRKSWISPLLSPWFLIDGFLYPKYHWTNWSDWRGSKVQIWEPFLGPGIITNVITALGNSLGILCKLDNKVVNQLVWYKPWSRWSMTPIISPRASYVETSTSGPTWAGGWVSRVLRWFFLSKSLLPVTPRAGKKELQDAPISVPNLHASVGSRIPTWLGLFCFVWANLCCLLFGVWFGFFALF